MDMRNLSKRGLDFSSPQKPHFSFSPASRAIDREAKAYSTRSHSGGVPLIRRLISLDALSRFQASARRSAAVAAAVLISVLILTIALDSASKQSAAGDGPKNIRGTIYDSVGNPVAGANVTVRVMHLEVPGATAWYDASELDGFYTVWFAYTEWQVDDIFEVTASISGHTDTNNSPPAENSQPILFTNVTIGSLTIPEFGAFLHSPVAFVSLGMIALFVVLRRRASK
jgi:hypothetical protein